MQMEKEFDQAEHRAIEGVPSTLSVRDFNLWYNDGGFQALKHISLEIPERRATAFIGPSGCGKSTLLRTFNRMCDFVEGVKTEGTIEFRGDDVFKMDSNALRVHVGMVFQHPNPFPMSIRDNILYGPARMRKLSKSEGDDICEKTLTEAALWNEVKDTLDKSGLGLSGGQQQRLCIARALATNSTLQVEQLMTELSQNHTVVVVTHNMQQATRVADKTAFFYLGELIEAGPTKELFSNPREQRTVEYLSGRFS